MTIIHKVQLLPGTTYLNTGLPSTTKVLCAQLQRNVPTIWYSFELVEDDKLKPFKFAIVPTGQDFDGENFEYLGTVQYQEGDFIYHVFYKQG
jgi:hypothetical protein